MGEKGWKDSPKDTIFIQQIPLGKNTIPKLVHHFGQFGHIQSVWVSGSKASIIFESEAGAMGALSSTVPYASNRFITIKPHKNRAAAKADLTLAVDMEKVLRVNAEACTAIDAHLSQSMLLREQMRQNRNGDKQLSEQQIRLMARIRDATPEELPLIAEKLQQLAEEQERAKESSV